MEIEEGGILVMSIVVIGIVLVIAIGIGSVTNINIQSNYANLVGHISVSQPDVLIQPDVLVQHSNGGLVGYNATTNTNVARGMALLEAVSNAVSGDSIYLKAETYDIGANTIDLSIGDTGTVNLHGAGKTKTIIETTSGTATTLTIGKVNSEITDLTLDRGMNSGYLIGYPNFGSGASNVILQNLNLNGYGDCIYLGAVDGGTFYNITANSEYDTLVVAIYGSGTFNIFDGNFIANAVVGSINSEFSSPYGVAFNPSGSFAYVINYASSNIVIVNTATNSVVGSINSGFSSPIGVAFNPSGSFAYVTNVGSSNVVIVNTATNSVVGSINSGFSSPRGVAFNPSGSFAYVTNVGSSNVVIVNTATNSVVGSINSGFPTPYGVAFNPSGSFAYVTNDGSSNVVIVNTATNSVVGSINSGFSYPQGVAFNPSGSFAYVTNIGGSNIAIVNTATNSVVGSINSGFSTPAGVAFNPSGSFAYVINYGSSNVVIVNTATNSVVGGYDNGIIARTIFSSPSVVLVNTILTATSGTNANTGVQANGGTVDIYGGRIMTSGNSANDLDSSSGPINVNSTVVYSTHKGSIGTLSPDTFGPYSYQKSPMTPPSLSSSQLANLSSQTNAITNTQGGAAAFLFWIFWMVVIITIVMMIVAKTKMN